MNYIDTHAHYNDEVFKDNLEETLTKCKQAGVDYIINIGYNKESSDRSLELAKEYGYIYTTIGIHPHDVGKDKAIDIYDIYQANHNNKKIVGIGEIGLDYAFVNDNKLAQSDLFIEQIEMANALNLPVIIHTRDASLDTYRILKENKPQHGLLFHCFHPTDDLVNMVLEEGYTVAFGGNITYKRNATFGNYIKKIPMQQIVIETDCPYLAPEPYRGTINTSAHLPIICKKLADYKEMDVEYVSEKVYKNSKEFFKIK
ncbi:MAG: TatD family hydrolase [Clostridia bacterium]|nr:TatD family hydrolase [Clostridia bacterium]